VAAFAVPTASHAAITPQQTFTTVVATSTDTNISWYMGSSTTNFLLGSVQLALANPNYVTGSPVRVRITCFDNQTSTSQSLCTDATAHSSTNEYATIPAELGIYTFYFGSGITLQAGRWYLMEIFTQTGLYAYGAPSLQFPNQCSYLSNPSNTDCYGAPYFQLNGSINWNALSLPLVYSTTSQAIAASSSMWQSIAVASSTPQCDTDNILSHALCSTAVFLFVPNQGVLDGYSQLIETTRTRFPLNYVNGVAEGFGTLSVSSTGNFAVLSIPLTSLDFASSTAFGSFLPTSVEILSTTTIQKYMPSGFWALMQTMIQVALWLGFAAYVFFTVRDRFFV